MCHGLELRCHRQPYKNALLYLKRNSTQLQYLKKYSLTDPTIGSENANACNS